VTHTHTANQSDKDGATRLMVLLVRVREMTLSQMLFVREQICTMSVEGDWAICTQAVSVYNLQSILASMYAGYEPLGL
jgi:hypothetical protein